MWRGEMRDDGRAEGGMGLHRVYCRAGFGDGDDGDG